MKKLLAVLLSLALALTLCACSGVEERYTVSKNGTNYLVDTQAGTVTDGKHVYRYTISGSYERYTIELTYPNGAIFRWQTQRNGSIFSGGGGWSDDYDPDRYADGTILCDVLEGAVPREPDVRKGLVVIVLLIAGVVNLVSPRTTWHWSHGWRYKDAEPSDAALTVNRVSGVVAILAALWMLFF